MVGYPVQKTKTSPPAGDVLGCDADEETTGAEKRAGLHIIGISFCFQQHTPPPHTQETKKKPHSTHKQTPPPWFFLEFSFVWFWVFRFLVLNGGGVHRSEASVLHLVSLLDRILGPFGGGKKRILNRASDTFSNLSV